MKQDVINWSRGRAEKLVSKETLNHPEFIQKVSGLDVYKNTQQAYLRAYQILGIDIINRVPSENAPEPTPKGQKKTHHTKPYSFTNLGVYDTAFREKFEAACPEDVFSINTSNLKYEDLIVPVPHPCKKNDIHVRQSILGDIGMYYPMLYTTLFMWPVETIGWENFMISAITEPERFNENFLKPFASKSKKIVEEIASSTECPFVFLHDDLADSNGPIFPLRWYEDYIFPQYKKIFEVAISKGKKIMFVADGNMTKFLPKLIELGVTGFMCENPATPLDIALDYFGQKGKFLIGGIETVTLSKSTPSDVAKHVCTVAEKTGDCPGFAISSCGGLHSDIPMENLEAYFNTRVEINATPENWKTKYN